MILFRARRDRQRAEQVERDHEEALLIDAWWCLTMMTIKRDTALENLARARRDLAYELRMDAAAR